jgi:thiamine-monophosphate kinase
VRSRELARVAALRARFAETSAGPRGAAIHVGIGDDAAVLEAIGAGSGALVWTVDAQVEGTHFRTDWASWEDIGWRSFMAAASDLAAMSAEPVAALSALVLASSVDDGALDALARGQAAASLAVGAPVVGGNLARGTETSITTTLLGRAVAPVLRSGARPGDGIWLAGPVGLAGVALAVLAQSVQDARIVDHADAAACLEAWRRPVARIAEGRGLAAVAHAAIDVSDGLAHDAWQLATAGDVRIVLDLAAVLAAGGEALAAGARLVGLAPEDFALHGGEDYALLAASDRALPGFVRIGSVEAMMPTDQARRDHGEDAPARVLLRTEGGIAALSPRGFDHFA